jgi:hypothetical protein
MTICIVLFNHYIDLMNLSPLVTYMSMFRLEKQSVYGGINKVLCNSHKFTRTLSASTS